MGKNNANGRENILWVLTCYTLLVATIEEVHDPMFPRCTQSIIKEVLTM